MTDIFDRLDDIEANGAYEHYKPLTEAADEFIRFAEHPELRINMGIELIDRNTRGVAPGEIMVIMGFAHSGKTVLATELMMANHDKPIVLFTPDETRPLVLTKLASAELGVAADELERRIYRGEQAAREQLLMVANKYGQLAVYDQSVTIREMKMMFRDAELALGRKPAACIFDYADQLADAIDTKAKVDALKMFGKDMQTPMFVLHQTSRSGGGIGEELSMSSGAYGGEQQATFLVSVRRKKYLYMEQVKDLQKRLDNATNPNMQRVYEERIHEIVHSLIPRHRDTVSVGLLKNKRPPSQQVPEFDCKLDPLTGRITPIHKDDPDEEPDKPLVDTFVVGGSSATQFLKERN